MKLSFLPFDYQNKENIEKDYINFVFIEKNMNLCKSF